MNWQDTRVVWALIINISLLVWAAVGTTIYLVIVGRLDVVNAGNVVGPILGALLTFAGLGGGYAGYHFSSKAKAPDATQGAQQGTTLGG